MIGSWLKRRYTKEVPKKKPSLTYVFAADKAIQDAASNKWSFIDVFEAMNFPAGLDNIVIPFYVIARIDDFPGGAFELQVSILAPDKTIVAQVALSDASVPKEPVSVVLNMGPTVFNRSKMGKYKYSFALNGVTLPSSRFFFNVQETPNG